MESKQLDILNSYIHYREEGSGDPIVFLHGNPTSSYLWRNVIPHLSDQGRCLAPDLIGFGRSGKPPIEYRFVDHARYLEAWFESMGLKRVTLVLHDWGATLGCDWARRHPERVSAIAFMEGLLREFRWEEFTDEVQVIWPIKDCRTPGVGEKLIVDNNHFIEKMLPGWTMRKLSDAEMNVYREPFIKPADRKPIYQWPNEVPIEGKPADVGAVVEENRAYLGLTLVPKLLLTFEPGVLIRPKDVERYRSEFANLEIRPAGKGLHYVQEDEPETIGKAIADWRRRKLN